MVDGDITKVDDILNKKHIEVLNWLILLKDKNDRIREEMRRKGMKI